MNRAVFLLVALVGAARAGAQTSEPLRKSDLIRLLTGGALSHGEIADLIRRNCLSFTPTARDRTDLAALGADSLIMARIAGCARGRATSPVTTPGPVAAAAPIAVVPLQSRVTVARVAPPPVVATRPPRTARPAPTSTGWVAGTAQRGVVGRRAAVPLIFEARDSTGAPIVGVPVALAVANGRLLTAPEHTDSAGAVRVELEFGPRAAATTVTATVGSLVRQATLYPAAGPATRLLVFRGRDTVSRRLELDPEAPTNLLVVPADAFGNPLPVRGLLAAVGDGSVLKVAGVTTDSLGGHVSLRPGRAGGSATNLALQASGLRADLTASVRARRP